jgi:hypothetical protein
LLVVAVTKPTAQSSVLPIPENFVAETWDTPSENVPISFSHSVPSPAQSHYTSAPQLTAEQGQQLLALGDDLEQLWDHPRSPATLKKRILRTVLQEVVANTTDDPPSVHLKPHWAGGFTHRAHRAQEPDRLSQPHQLPRSNGLIREVALVCEADSIASILKRLRYRTGNSNIWTEKSVQHVRHTNGFPACPPPDQRLWMNHATNRRYARGR